MKYCFCWQVERVVEDRAGGQGEVMIEDDEGRTIVACGLWRDTQEEANRDGELFRKDRESFFRQLNGSEG